MKSIITKVTFLFAFMAMSLPAQALNPYTKCGIGAALFPETPVAAVSSNVIWDAGTTAITSATASPETCSEEQTSTAQFILETLPQLESDMALGEGEHVEALASLMQCDDASALVGAPSQNYGAFVASAAYTQSSNREKSSVLYDALKESNLQTCKAIL